jgi:phosphomannomutase/phosphoglucomutase
VHVARKIFRAYDIRGIAGATLSEPVIRVIGQSIGSIALDAGCTRFVVARDGRVSGPALHAALIEGLLSTGLDVIDMGAVPTPVLYYATFFEKTSAGAMLTGSHNPAEYNGIKTMLLGQALAGEGVWAVYQRIVRQDFRTGNGIYTQKEIIGPYIAEISARITLGFGKTKKTKPIKVVIDCGNGITGVIAPQLYRALGCEVVALYETVDGTFPNHHPDPSLEKNLTDLKAAVLTHKADLGLAFDGDGDRLGVVTATGRMIEADRQIMLFSRDILQRHPGALIVYDVKCTQHLAPFIQARGGVPCLWRTGHSFIKAKMHETGALLGGEMSGHLFFKDRWFGFDDALYAGARLLEILAGDPGSRTLDEICEDLPVSFNTPEFNIPLEDEYKFQLIDDLKKRCLFRVGERHIVQIIEIDGVRVECEDGWGLVRPSNTLPALVLRFEASSQEALMRIQADFKCALLSVCETLQIPF